MLLACGATLSRVESVPTNVLMTLLIGPDHIPTFPRLSAHSRAPPRLTRPVLPGGIPARASPEPRGPNRHPHDSIPGLRTRVRAPPLRAITRQALQLYGTIHVVTSCTTHGLPRVPENCTTSQQASVTIRASILAPITTSPVPASRPDTTRLIPVTRPSSFPASTPHRTTRGNFPFTGP